MKEFSCFAVKVTVAQAVTYIVAGLIAYPLFYRQFFEGSSPLFASWMRIPGDPQLWGHVLRWGLPAQILRGILLAGALYPFLNCLQGWTFTKRFLSIAALYVVVGQWASALPAPNSIEGWVYLRPEFTTSHIVLTAIPEGLIQGLGFGAWFALWSAPKPPSKGPNILRAGDAGLHQSAVPESATRRAWALGGVRRAALLCPN
jgi:hypothetical protein